MKILAARLVVMAFVLLGCGLASTAAPDADTDTVELPKVLVIATGGTIAGVQNAPVGTLGNYRAGSAHRGAGPRVGPRTRATRDRRVGAVLERGEHRDHARSSGWSYPSASTRCSPSAPTSPASS